MKHKAFYDTRQAQAYLCRSVFKFGNKLVQVANVHEVTQKKGALITALYLHNEEPVQFWSSDEEFSLDPLPVGMTQLTVGTNPYDLASVRRSPKRQWKLGTNANTIDITMIRERNDGRPVVHSHMSIFNDPGWHRALLGQYPKLDEALNSAVNSGVGCPFSRRFAVTPSFNVFHYLSLDAPVGRVDGSGEVELFYEFKYLREALDEDMTHES